MHYPVMTDSGLVVKIFDLHYFHLFLSLFIDDDDYVSC